MKLIIMRHGEAGSAATDFERCLSQKGRYEVKKMALSQQADLQGAQAYVSPYVRAQQTLATLAEHVPINRQSTLSIITPDNHPDQVIQWLSEQEQAAFPLLLVSHQPLVSALISQLVHGDYQGYYPMSTASVTVLEADVWAKGLGNILSQTHVADLD